MYAREKERFSLERKNQKAKKHENQTQAKAIVTETYFRLCHFCFHLNEADQPIMECTECSNLLSSEPIEEFYEDLYESVSASNSADDDEEESETNTGVLPQLGGLSVIW